jgi:hypothetical protein
MKKTILFVYLVSLAGISSCQTVDNQFQGDNKINFVSYNKLPIVEGKINNRKAYFILDSGASISVLDETQSRKFNFDVEESSSEAAGYGGIAQFSSVYNADLELGGLPMTTNFKGQDLTAIIATMEASEGITISGIIGNDIMKPNKFIINFADETISIGK